MGDILVSYVPIHHVMTFQMFQMFQLLEKISTDGPQKLGHEVRHAGGKGEIKRGRGEKEKGRKKGIP
jgi:hypothetical protein